MANFEIGKWMWNSLLHIKMENSLESGFPEPFCAMRFEKCVRYFPEETFQNKRGRNLNNVEASPPDKPESKREYTS